MGSWQYAFMFPGHGDRLTPDKAVAVLSGGGFAFGNKCYGAVVTDLQGHLEYTQETVLSDNPTDELAVLLSKGEALQAECHNRDIFLMFSSGVRYRNPHMVLAWSRHLFSLLRQQKQDEHWSLVRRLAAACGAKYVVVINDVPDGFEDHLVEVDGHPILDRHLPSGREYDIFAAWIRNLSTASRSVHFEVPDVDDVGEGFSKWAFE